MSLLLLLCFPPVQVYESVHRDHGKRANELRIDMAARTNAEARFNAPPHQSELN
jgi:hypothetical protein